MSSARSLDGAAFLAGGQPIGEATARQAAQWLTLLMSGEASEEDRLALQRWREAHADNDRAWRHIEAVTGRMGQLSRTQRQAAYGTLSPYSGSAPPQSGARRTAMRVAGWGGLAAALALFGTRSQLARELVADQRTATGERRTLVLDDGTRITLNTGTAIDVRFDGARRAVRLLRGEVMVVTGHAPAGLPDGRPFIVETSEGRIRALGTRFTVRQLEGSTAVAVLESAVEITPAARASAASVLRAGRRGTFTATAVSAAAPAGEQDAAWTRGQIVADDLPLADFLADLSRYRAGILECTPAVARLRLSGVFPLDDTDRILATLAQVLPVQVRTRTRYWVTVDSAP
jgi:transmembrane sensor